MFKISKIKPIMVICLALVLATSIITVVAFSNENTDNNVTSSNANSVETGSDTLESSEPESTDSSDDSSSTPSKPKTTKPVVYKKAIPAELKDYCVTSIKVVKKPTKTVYKLGETIDLTGMQVVGYFSNGTVWDITDYVQIFWDRVKSVSDKLQLNVEFTDWSEGINIAGDVIYVKSTKPSLDVSIDNTNLTVGDTAKLTATTDAVDWPIEWYSDNTAVATVDANGNVTTVGEGTANIYAVIKYGNGKVEKACAITVTAPAVS